MLFSVNSVLAMMLISDDKEEGEISDSDEEVPLTPPKYPPR